jgi:hypothetical protein
MDKRHGFDRSAGVRDGDGVPSFAPSGAHLTLAIGFVSSGFLVGLLGRLLLGFAFGVRQQTDARIRWSVGSHSAVPFWIFAPSRERPKTLSRSAHSSREAKTPERNIAPRSGVH